MGFGSVALTVAKWAAGIGATVVATDLLNNVYQENKGKIGKTFSKWVTELGEMWQENYERDIGSVKVERLDQTASETAPLTGREKEQTNGLQGSMDYTEFNEWLKSAEGQKFLNETAVNLRTTKAEDMNPSKEEQIDGIQGRYDTSEQYRWETSEAGKNWLEQAEKIRLENEAKEKEGITTGEEKPNPDDEYKDKTPPTDTPGEGIEDKTDENLGTNNISAMDWMEWAKQEQADRWAREDQIRAETQAREDTAWQRGIADLRKSGANINLVAAQPAASGGGITQASGQNLSGLTTQMNIDLDKMQQMIDNAFKGEENDKDRFIDMFGTVISLIGLIAALKK